MGIQSRGIRDCIEEVISRYSGMVYRIALNQMKSRSQADDVYQEVFLRYIRNEKEFKSEEHRKAWLIRVTLNCCRKEWDSSWNRKTTGLDERADREIHFETREEDELFYAVNQLPDNQRISVYLFYYEEYSVAEIGDLLGTGESTVRTWLTRARSQLRKTLEGGR